MKILAFSLLIAFGLQAQNVIKKDIGEFNTLKVYDLIDVEMIPSNTNRVEISGDNKRDVVIANKNGTLKIKMNIEEILDGNKTNIKLYYTKVAVIDVNEGATITTIKPIKQFELDLKAQEGGTINAETDVSFLSVKAVTGGIITASGTAEKQNITINTGGVFNGKDLKTEVTEVSISAGGEAHVNASDTVDLKIRAGGDIFIYGKPKTVDESRVFGGRVKYVDK